MSFKNLGLFFLVLSVQFFVEVTFKNLYISYASLIFFIALVYRYYSVTNLRRVHLFLKAIGIALVFGVAVLTPLSFAVTNYFFSDSSLQTIESGLLPSR